jgi:transposase
VPLLMSTPGIGWVLACTIAAEIGEIERFASAKKPVGCTGLCPRVYQSGASDRRGPLAKKGPQVPALGPDRSRHPCRQPSLLRRPPPGHP